MSTPAERDAASMWMGQYATGDDCAFRPVYEYVAPRLRAFLVKQTRDACLADDLVQQTLLQMHCARRAFAAGADVIPWAFAIARRLMIDAFRKHRRESLTWTGVDHDDERPLACGPFGARPDDPEATLATKQLAARLGAELARLPKANRDAFALVKHDGLSMTEAAAVLGTTVGAVKLRAHRAYQALRAIAA